jgi:5-keto 4-deoxyuronate isomerase
VISFSFGDIQNNKKGKDISPHGHTRQTWDHSNLTLRQFFSDLIDALNITKNLSHNHYVIHTYVGPNQINSCFHFLSLSLFSLTHYPNNNCNTRPARIQDNVMGVAILASKLNANGNQIAYKFKFLPTANATQEIYMSISLAGK